VMVFGGNAKPISRRLLGQALQHRQNKSG
jgi:hypothetical protein